MGPTFDMEALIRSIILGVGVVLFVNAIIRIFFDKIINTNNLIMLSTGLLLLIVLICYYAWPSLPKVPDLTNKSRAEAESLLVSRGLVPNSIPQYNQETEPERVIPHSQSPLPGIRVYKGTAVKFAVSLGPVESRSERPSVSPRPSSPPDSTPSVSLFRPRSNEAVVCKQHADGIYRFLVEGTASGMSENLRLLLWIKPVDPPSQTHGWYLQRPPVNGISKVNPDGSWQGIAQIGNVQWPPHKGDILDVAVTIVDRVDANRLLAQRGEGTSPDLPGIVFDTASNIRVELK